MLQRAGGNFPLLADVNFGTSFGLISKYYKSTSPNIAGAGTIRLANSDTIDWRNFGNTADLPLGVNSSNQLTFNGSAIAFTGAVNSGTQYQLTYYATTGDTVSGLTLITPNQALISDTNGLPIAATTTAAELEGLHALTANQALETNGSGIVTTSSTTSTELGYVHGVTSAIQTQINNTLPLAGGTMSGAINMGGNQINNMANGVSAQDAATVSQVNSVAGFQPGDLKAAAYPTIPSGWLLCNGASYAPSAYPGLFSAIRYTWGGSGGTIALVQTQNLAIPATNPKTYSGVYAPTGTGNLLVVMFSLEGSSGDIHVTGITDNVGNTYQIVPGASDIDPTNSITAEVWYAKNSISGATSITVTYNATPAGYRISVSEYSGVDPVNPIIDGEATEATGTPILGPALTTSDPNALLVTVQFANATASGVNSPWHILSGDPTNTSAQLIAPGSTGTFQAVFPPSGSTLYISAGAVFASQPTGNFNVPNLVNAVPVGQGGSIAPHLGSSSGAVSQTFTPTQVAHAHATTTSYNSTAGNIQVDDTSPYGTTSENHTYITTTAGGDEPATSLNYENTSAVTAINNPTTIPTVQPSIGINWLIKT